MLLHRLITRLSRSRLSWDSAPKGKRGRLQPQVVKGHLRKLKVTVKRRLIINLINGPLDVGGLLLPAGVFPARRRELPNLRRLLSLRDLGPLKKEASPAKIFRESGSAVA